MAVGGVIGEVELVGREGEVDRLRRFVEQLPNTARAALVRGDGIGKTVLWRDALEAAEAAGIMVLATRCVEAEMPIALGGLSDLFDVAFGDVAGELAEPQRRALAVALGTEDSPQAAPDNLALPRAVVAALRGLAARSPVLVAVDDVQWLDAASQRVLAFAFRRVGTLPVGALVTLRGAIDAHDPLDLVGAFGVDRFDELELTALSSGALRHLVHSRLAIRLGRPTLLRVHAASGGNPMFALEFARLLASRGDAPRRAPLSMPASLRELVRERVARFPPEIHPLLELVSTLERPTLAILVAAFGCEAAEELLAEAQRADAVAVGEDGVARFTHPLLASTVYGDATPQRRRALHAQAADLLTDLEARAAHLALAAEGPDAAPAALLDEAAQRAAARGTPDAAAELVERAQLLTPPLMAREGFGRALTAARYLIEAAQSGRAAAVLDALLAGDVTGRDRAEALQLRATVDPDGAVAIELRLAEVEWRAGELDAAERHAAEAAEIFLDGGDLWGSGQVLTRQALLAAIRGKAVESRRLAQEAISHEDKYHVKYAALANRWVLGFLDLSLDQPVRAHELLGPLPEALEELGIGEPGFIPALPDAIETLVALGRLDEAEAVLRRLEGQAVALQHRWATPATLRCQALLLLARGEANPALASAEEAVAGFEAAGFPLDGGRALLVAGDALRRLGERRRAADKLEAAKAAFAKVGAALWLERAEKELRRANPRRRKDRDLTGTERRVAALVASGLTNREVAGQLFTTVSTVETHLTRIYRKAGVRSRTELARRVATGELRLDDT